MNKQFSLSEILGSAWALAKKNIWVLMGFTAIQFLGIILIPIVVRLFLTPKFDGIVVWLQLLITLINTIFMVAIYQVLFKLIDEDEDPTFPDFLPNIVKALNFILVQFMLSALVVFFIAIIAAAYFLNTPQLTPVTLLSWKNSPLLILISMLIIFVSIKMYFVLCFIVDQESGAIEAIRQSWLITKGQFWFLFSLSFVCLSINLLGLITFVVGLLFTIPFSSLITIVAYRQIVNSYIEDENTLIDNSDIE